ncbi:DDE-type integrase/transposase/recombinase [Streptomyces sp. NPDC060286]|uniref:DDE-type integrase/transposase/recombinase n=1 Tax=unclassified Streptomyces TaxID=2593676 RepID=UPI00365DA0A0
MYVDVPTTRRGAVAVVACPPGITGQSLDLATREVVGYSMADHHRADLVVDALKMAAGRGRLRPGCIAHSDRGSEYTSSQFRLK